MSNTNSGRFLNGSALFYGFFPSFKADSSLRYKVLCNQIISAAVIHGILSSKKEVWMTKRMFAVLVLGGSLALAGLAACDARAEDAMSAPTSGRSFAETVKDGYNHLKHSVTSAFGGYTGDASEDSQTYMENYRSDLRNYHDSLQEARDKYRNARLDEQKSYLEHHRTLPMNEDIDADVNTTMH